LLSGFAHSSVSNKPLGASEGLAYSQTLIEILKSTSQDLKIDINNILK
jgi:hypothetical protein